MSETPHGKPPVDCECQICFDDIDESSYVEYKCAGGVDGPWQVATICATCTEYLRTSQYNKYVSDLAKTKCAAEQRRLLEAGPPINLFEPHGLPCGCGGCDGPRAEVALLWYAGEGDKDPKLEGSLVGEARQAWWNEQKKFRIVDEDAPADPATE
ncbi:uncharacterized protein AMSG_03701 [Thecamonas trahens ATCC 50062]|uniref:Uncharacterized protein n=1 Tax=Thecamonas trahens ATCC 50062 TaxID=461836 RepID=A0A0L0D5B6_THETB|nr:hypothetical protein AMSG_03701 [Thecamonas trahens ATCC 50062]KNC47271.1 hypothetical protein AMSG_03701 [Thecamonas trahens ATCC 50062]|eukprot:XP_013759614.1 hypothetical protein AMSG_03701 [Thecamonas trahens ATCC 50062]